jgi:hypothetical protein
VEENYLTGLDYSCLPWCNEAWEKLVPKNLTHPAASRQGQLLVAAFTLVWEVRNAGANWDDTLELFLACQEFVTRDLCDGTFDSRVCEYVRGAFAELSRWMGRESEDYTKVYDSIGRVYTLAHHWCRLHSEPLPPQIVCWERAAQELPLAVTNGANQELQQTRPVRLCGKCTSPWGGLLSLAFARRRL